MKKEPREVRKRALRSAQPEGQPVQRPEDRLMASMGYALAADQEVGRKGGAGRRPPAMPGLQET